jgi:LysM repeat protein
MAVLSSILLLGSILLSYAENGYALALPAAGAPTTTALHLIVMASGMPPSEMITPRFRSTDTPTFTPKIDCPVKAGFVKYVVQPGETLSDLAHKYSTSGKTILIASCIETAGLSSVNPIAGSELQVPILHPTSVVGYCPAPPGWILHTVQPGENLFDLSLVTHVHVPDLQAANCLGSSTKIIAGQRLYLPFIPYSPPSYTAVFPPTVTPSATASRTPLIPPSWTPVVPATNSGSASSATPSTTTGATATNNPSPTSSDTPAFQPPSSTPIPPDTDTPVPPPTDTTVPPPTETPIPPPSNTPVPPPSDTPLTEPKEISPVPPESTEGIGSFLYPSFVTLLKV